MSQENNASKQPLIRHVNRQQMSWRAVGVERLIGEDHAARAIWALVGRLDLSGLYRSIESNAEEGGRPAFDPQLLISLWVYAYSQGLGAAREVARGCEYDPAFQWLTGLEEVNYHTLADFRVEKQKELDELCTQVLAALSKERLITLEQVMQDGTKIKALASTGSYHHEGTIREHLERARQRVAEMGDPRSEESSPKTRKAHERARREQQERLESALEELQKLQERRSGEKAKSKTRVRTSDPQARVLHHSDGGLSLSYNAQISTDAANGLLVGVAVTQAAEDSAPLLPAVHRVQERLKEKPQQLVADGGYTRRENIEQLAGREIDFVGSMKWENVPSGTTAAGPASAQHVCLRPRAEYLRLPGRQVVRLRLPAHETSGFSDVRLYRREARLSELCAQTAMLSGKSEARPFGYAPGGKRAGGGVPAEDGHRPGPGAIPPSQPGGGIRPRVDQK